MDEATPPQPAVAVTNTTVVSNAVVQISAAQVWSSALQNIAIAGCVTAGWLTGKVGSEIALVVLCLIAGIDLAGRKKLVSTAGNALAVGATGGMTLLAKFPHIGVVIMAALTAWGLLG